MKYVKVEGEKSEPKTDQAKSANFKILRSD